jgi:transcriptional regulator with XRE-family HTH domain
MASVAEVFDSRTFVSLGSSAGSYGVPGLEVLAAGPGAELAQPADLLREIHRFCHQPGRRLLLFESVDSMVRRWGAGGAREFFARCCPLLLEVGAIAYWAMGPQSPPALQDAVRAVTQCVLAVDDHSVRVVKAEGRDDTVRGTVLHWHERAGRPVLSPPEVVDRVAASLRAIRRARRLSQHDLGDLAGVTASAISQVERAERGLSLATLVRLTGALGVTLDDLLRGEDPGAYHIGRRVDDPQRGPEPTVTLLDGTGTDVHADLVHLGPREAGAPERTWPGTGIIAVAGGLLQVLVAGQTPAIRHGEVLVADSERIESWRNLGQAEATLFWIVIPSAPGAPMRRIG